VTGQSSGGRKGVRWFSVLIGLWLALASARARAQVKMEFTGPGSSSAPIAISQLKNLGGDDDGALSDRFIDVLSRDVRLSGYFRIINPQSYIESPQTSGYQLGQFNFGDWSSINAEFLVKGSVRRGDDGVTIEAFLYDVGGQRQLAGKRFQGPPQEVPRMARRFADALLQAVTGKRGPFDTRLAMVATQGERFKEIYLSTIDGVGMFRVTNNPTINLSPSLDHSAGRVLYVSYKTGAPELYLYDLATRRETRIVSHLGSLLGGAVMPDGNAVVAAIERGGATNLFMLDTAGNEIRQLTHGASINVDPALNADGSLMAFTSDRGGTPQIYVMSTSGGAARRITYQGDYNTNPAFSPDGSKLAYQSRKGGFQIEVISANGGGEPTHLAAGQHPSWSPDGRYIVFSSGFSGESRLYLMQADTGKIIAPITKEESNATDPAWSWWLGD